MSCERGNVRKLKRGMASAHLGKAHTRKITLLQRWILEAYIGKKMAISKACRHVGEFNDDMDIRT